MSQDSYVDPFHMQHQRDRSESEYRADVDTLKQQIKFLNRRIDQLQDGIRNHQKTIFRKNTELEELRNHAAHLQRINTRSDAIINDGWDTENNCWRGGAAPNASVHKPWRLEIDPKLGLLPVVAEEDGVTVVRFEYVGVDPIRIHPLKGVAELFQDLGMVGDSLIRQLGIPSSIFFPPSYYAAYEPVDSEVIPPHFGVGELLHSESPPPIPPPPASE